MAKRMKTGTRVLISGNDWDGTPTHEPARIIRAHRECLPMPDGYYRVRFDNDRAVLLVHANRMEAAA